MQVLSRVLSWAVDRGRLAINVAAGTEQLYSSDRAGQIWTPEEIARYKAASRSPEVAFIVLLACVTGLRREDLAGLTWSHVGKLAIVKPTGKSRGRKVARIISLSDTEELLKRIKAQQERRMAAVRARAEKNKRPAPPKPVHVLTNTRGKAWTVNGLEHQVIDTKAAAGVDKHLHDARGTFATRLPKAGLTAPGIADVLGWEEERVERLLATCVDQDAIIQSIAERIRKSEKFWATRL